MNIELPRDQELYAEEVAEHLTDADALTLEAVEIYKLATEAKTSAKRDYYKRKLIKLHKKLTSQMAKNALTHIAQYEARQHSGGE